MSTTKIWPSQASVNVTPTSYPLPQAGDVNWASLTDFLVALANGAQSTTFQRFANRTALVSPVTVTSNDCIVCTNLTTPAAVAVNLPAGVDKQILIISDNKGDARTNAITITPNGSETVGGAANLVLNTNNEAVILGFQASTGNWNVVAKGVPNPSGSAVGGFTPNMGIVSNGSGNLTASVATATEVGYVSGVTSALQPQLDGKQPLDADLTAIAAVSSTGLATRTAADTWTTRSVTVGSSKISITNGDGVAGNPVLDAVEANFTLDNIGGVLGVAKGGTSVTSVTTAPAPSSFAGWDANKNLSANSFIPGYATTATAGGTTTLTVSSTQLQYFTGTSAQTVVLPVTSTLVLGQSFNVVNNSTQSVTVQSSGANSIQVMAASSAAKFTCILTSGTTAASWAVEYKTAAAGTVTSVDVSGGTTGLTTSGGPVTTSGTVTLAGTLVVGNGGTGLTGGTSGGVLAYTASNTIASSAALTNNQIVVGGGAGAVPKTLAAGTAGQYLKMNSSPIPAWFSISSPTIRRFTSGSGNYVVAANVVWLLIEQVGGGGGGGGGAGGASGGNGTAGTATTFSAAGGAAFVTCNGGGRGGGGALSTSDPGGTVSIAAPAVTMVSISGQRGSSTPVVASGSFSMSGLGGASGLSPGAGATAGSGNTGDAAPVNSGAGGGGGAAGSTTSNAGGAGGSGGGYAKYIIPATLAASYDYSIGSAGSGGAAGGGTGGTGGAGAAGLIIITEMYV